MAEEERTEEELVEELEDLEELEEEPEETEEEQPKQDLEDVSKKLEALEREKDGLYKEMMNERKTRQELKAQVELITKLVSEAKDKRSEKEPEPENVGGIPVKFDDDGNPFIDPTDLKAIASPDVMDIKKDVSAIKDQAFYQDIQSKNTAIISEAVSKDERYPQAYKVLNDAFQFLDGKTTTLLRQKGVNLSDITLDDAIEMLEKEGVADELTKQYPGLDIDMVIESRTQGPNGLFNKRKLNKALKTIVSSSGNGKNGFDNFKLIASKPGNLAGVSNQKGSAGRTLNDIADLDLEAISDADFKKLERALEKAGV